MPIMDLDTGEQTGYYSMFAVFEANPAHTYLPTFTNHKGSPPPTSVFIARSYPIAYAALFGLVAAMVAPNILRRRSHSRRSR